jgi:hypothetical protein
MTCRTSRACCATYTEPMGLLDGPRPNFGARPKHADEIHVAGSTARADQPSGRILTAQVKSSDAHQGPAFETGEAAYSSGWSGDALRGIVNG